MDRNGQGRPRGTPILYILSLCSSTVYIYSSTSSFVLASTALDVWVGACHYDLIGLEYNDTFSVCDC